MIVYGDQSRTVETGEALASLRDLVRSGPMQPVEAHGRLVGALIEAGQLWQATADLGACEGGVDRTAPGERSLMTLTCQLAQATARSWASGFAHCLSGPLADAITAAERAGTPARRIELREPEGYACYALYPETYWQAAMRVDGPVAAVVGIRSIGTSLSAMVAAATGAGVPATVRPAGHPFDRRVDIDPALAGLSAASAGSVAIVDEGPGLSGSSFGAVADALGAHGVAPERIILFPSHGNGPGAQASDRHRALWATARRAVTTFEDVMGDPLRPEHRLEHWVSDLTGGPTRPLEDIAGGRWRAVQDPDGRRWPPADAPGERRKYLLGARGGGFLLKFTGLGRGGMRRFDLQRRLGHAGFTTLPAGWRHGFTVEPWRGDLRGLHEAGIERSAVVGHLGAYLGFRAAALPAADLSGASLDALYAMLSANVSEALGPDAAQGLDAWRPHLPRLAKAMRRVVTDNRLHAWEWRVSQEGRLLKMDAVDHHASHDLIGCQDIAWDMAGAMLEFDLSPDELNRIRRTVEARSGASPDPDLIRFYGLAYPAFQLGLSLLAAGRNGEADAARWRLHLQRYRAALERGLGGTPGAASTDGRGS